MNHTHIHTHTVKQEIPAANDFYRCLTTDVFKAKLVNISWQQTCFPVCTCRCVCVCVHIQNYLSHCIVGVAIRNKFHLNSNSLSSCVNCMYVIYIYI